MKLSALLSLSSETVSQRRCGRLADVGARPRLRLSLRLRGSVVRCSQDMGFEPQIRKIIAKIPTRPASLGANSNQRQPSIAPWRNLIGRDEILQFPYMPLRTPIHSCAPLGPELTPIHTQASLRTPTRHPPGGTPCSSRQPGRGTCATSRARC